MLTMLVNDIVVCECYVALPVFHWLYEFGCPASQFFRQPILGRQEYMADWIANFVADDDNHMLCELLTSANVSECNYSIAL